MALITLTTDFGYRDGFVGIMKGIIAQRCPRAAIVDITHDLPPGDLRAGAFVLANASPWFPPGTIHVAVVDPGVGSDRPAIAIRRPTGILLAPDNGVLSWAVRNESHLEVRRLVNLQLFLHPVSRTFHGRDIFAPVAARLAAGFPFHRVGPEVKDFARLPYPLPRPVDGGGLGEILHVDRFGNAITNLPNPWVETLPAGSTCVCLGARKTRVPLGTCYQSVKTGQAVVVAGSSGCLEIAIRDGSAAARFRLKPGVRVALLSRRETKAR